jgi:hypothetical protein
MIGNCSINHSIQLHHCRRLHRHHLLQYLKDHPAVVRIVVTTSTNTSVTVTHAPLKYNKKNVFNFEVDDGPMLAYNFLSFFCGGTDSFGVKHPGLYMGDGTGDSVHYTMAIANNSRNSFNNDELHTGNYWWMLSKATGCKHGQA